MGWTLVTGAAKGLGREICLTLADQGYDLVVHFRHSQHEAETLILKLREKGVRAEKIEGDFSSIQNLEEFTQRYFLYFKETSALINNIGNYFLGSALKTPSSVLQELFFTNVTIASALSQALITSLKQSKGTIINIGAAGCSRASANTYSTAYNMTKLALTMLTTSLAKELLPDQVRVNMVSPGYLENSVDLPTYSEAFLYGRPGLLKEAAETVAFLMSPQAAYITGQNIEVAGGVRL